MTKYQVAGVVFLLLTTVTAKIKLVGHGYEKIAVVINPDVDVNPLLLTTLEDILTQGSAALLRATKNQAYFKEFIIVLPENWPTLQNYENTLDGQIDKPDIDISPPNAKLGDNPYVNNPNGCGEEGEYMHLTPNYILNDTIRGWFGPPGRLIVHEFAHLRWGVLDEYGTNPQEEFYSYRGKWYPTRCTEEVVGNLVNADTGGPCETDSSTGRPAENCQFDPDYSSPTQASLMFMQHLTNVVEFCDNQPTVPAPLKHNKLAPNQQNKFCKYRSIWEVLREHKDFVRLASLPALPNNTDTQPQFRYVQVQSTSKKRVLILDTSGSMSGQPMAHLRQAASSFILGSIEIGSQLGIVQFSSVAFMLSPLVQIDSDDNREVLVNALPYSANGGTSIAAGLLQGIQVLESGSGSASGGSLILITDGEETSPPYISDVYQTLLNKNVTVHTIAIGQAADLQLATLSEDTGGQSFFYSGSLNSTGFIDGLTATVATENDLLPSKNVSISILTEVGIATPDIPLNGTFYIDSTIGRDTTLILTSEGHIEVEIESPDGPYDVLTTNEIARSGTHALKINLGDIITTGLWSYQVSTTIFPSVVVTVNVQSKPQNQVQDILQIRSWMSRAQNETVSFSSSTTLGVYAEVMRGKTPVVNASVIATVETPRRTTFDLHLFDKGIGIDTLKEDGIYSATIIAPDLDEDGRYSIKVKVVGSRRHTKVFVAGEGTGKKAFNPRTRGFSSPNVQTSPLEDFQRVTTAGEFRITNYVSLTTDGLPPARITDFSLMKFEAKNRTATLEWTAVGGDLDRGQAARYLIYVSHDEEVIIGNTSSASLIPPNQILQGDLNSTVAAGDREEMVVYVQELDTNTNDTIYMSIVAVDDADNQGEPSNLVIISDAKEMWRNNDDIISIIGSGSNFIIKSYFHGGLNIGLVIIFSKTLATFFA